MIEEQFFHLLEFIEKAGLWLSIVAWLSVAGGAIAMGWVLRGERRTAFWVAALVVGTVAFAANLLDYAVTLYRSPDLALEANPLWRNVVERWGLGVAKWYGLTGKIFVSILAGQMFAFYLSHRERLFPDRCESFFDFIGRMGNRSRNVRERFVALFTLFAFFFAGIQLLYFYIAYLNSVDEQSILDALPSVPMVILILMTLLGTAFVLTTYRAFLVRTRSSLEDSLRWRTG